jgi:hypothetical protein
MKTGVAGRLMAFQMHPEASIDWPDSQLPMSLLSPAGTPRPPSAPHR